ncbi:TetR family transcriptional regulator [Stenotrophomonas rhizophila]|jgi:AcrR family transcriptional regulator|uniref:TetR family transcriptional regulator n=1 Tax=Stenotrophomonas rhizophila TaxID=216778 RepID=UPI00081C6A59|nr:TetR family transcriptional regulator [Stenotrophomonas rhizophila]AOA72058.1 hypothetical protein BAY15_1624 [Stenotrophomonas rhizophila]
MARPRSIDPNHLLDAAERVVARHGVPGLTLEAVAAEAGISKASVLYDHGSKTALVQAVLVRALQRDRAQNQAAVDAVPAHDSPVIKGRLAAAAQPLPDAFRPVALSLVAAMAGDSSLRGPFQQHQREVIEAVETTSQQPRGAMLAYLALEGLKLLEALDYHRWPVQQREQLLRDIAWLVEQVPPD